MSDNTDVMFNSDTTTTTAPLTTTTTTAPLTTTTTGGKTRKANSSLKAWVAFIKRVQKEEGLSYRDAMMRAKVRKDKGEKWLKGGDPDASMIPEDDDNVNAEQNLTNTFNEYDDTQSGGKHRRKSRSRKNKSKSRKSRSRKNKSRSRK